MSSNIVDQDKCVCRVIVILLLRPQSSLSSPPSFGSNQPERNQFPRVLGTCARAEVSAYVCQLNSKSKVFPFICSTSFSSVCLSWLQRRNVSSTINLGGCLLIETGRASIILSKSILGMGIIKSTHFSRSQSSVCQKLGSCLLY